MLYNSVQRFICIGEVIATSFLVLVGCGRIYNGRRGKSSLLLQRIFHVCAQISALTKITIGKLCFILKFSIIIQIMICKA